MRTTILIVAIAILPSTSLARDPFDPKLGADWKPARAPAPYEDWSWRVWRNERGDLFTIATNSVARGLTSSGDLDRAMDFASSAFPQWIDTQDYPSWGHGDEYDPRFLKLEADSVRNPRSKTDTIPIVSYVMVNDGHKRPFMAVGAVVCIGNATHYIQHNSKHPIADGKVDVALRRLVRQSVSEAPP